MNCIVNKGKVRADGNLLADQILILGFRQWKQRIFLFLLEQIPAGIVELGEINAVLCFHPLPQFSVQLFQGIEGHFVHFHEDMHGNDAYVAFHIGFPPRCFHFRRQNDCSIVSCPGLEFRIQNRIDPVLVLGYGNLAV